MKRCDPKARAKCPDGKQCELYAEFADGSECDKFNEKVLSQPMTNADRIRAMSDEELAKQFVHTSICDQKYPKCKKAGEDCVECLLEWLQQPAVEEPE